MIYSGAPCKDCAKRKRACHDSCPEYKEWKSEKDVEKSNRRKEQFMVDLINAPRRRKKNW